MGIVTAEEESVLSLALLIHDRDPGARRSEYGEENADIPSTPLVSDSTVSERTYADVKSTCDSFEWEESMDKVDCIS